MKKLGLLLAIISLMAVIAGCTNSRMDTTSKMVAPENKLTPVQGKWTITNFLKAQGEKDTKKSGEWIGKTASFSNDTIILGDTVWHNIGYKAKKVNVEEYFLHKYKGPVENLGINSREAYVITASADEKFVCEMVKINDKKVLVNIDNDFFCMEKVSDEFEDILESTASIESLKIQRLENGEPLTDSSGILMGIRSTEKSGSNKKSSDISKYSYRTLWIAYENQGLRPVLEAQDIFLPRKNGFWKLKVNEIRANDVVEDTLTASAVSKGIIEEKPMIKTNENTFWSGKNGVLRKAILYAGNDYVAVERVGAGRYTGSNESWSMNNLQVLPVDNISNMQGVKISDIVGESGRIAMERVIKSQQESYIGKQARRFTENQEENFALYRKTGHWFLKGRMELNSTKPFIDFNINIIPPKDLIAYDTLLLPWTNIKDRIPEAQDAFTSPNGDIAIILAKQQIMVYEINGKSLAETPLKKIKLEKGDNILMAEWATGYYVNKWESIFIRNNKVSVVR